MPLLWRYCLDDHVWLPEGRMPLNSNHQNRDRYANLEEDSDCDSNDSSRKWFEGRDLRNCISNRKPKSSDNRYRRFVSKQDETIADSSSINSIVWSADLSTFEDRGKIAALTYSLLLRTKRVFLKLVIVHLSVRLYDNCCQRVYIVS
ncbi:hypothetical protein J6590_010806 [Homalodisca vitripennis]|nr:hypothetical protein J6590_010806 [Homalodisca vitripennis]